MQYGAKNTPTEPFLSNLETVQVIMQKQFTLKPVLTESQFLEPEGIVWFSL